MNGISGFDLHEQALIDEQIESEWFFSLELHVTDNHTVLTLDGMAAAYNQWWQSMLSYSGDDAPRFGNSDPLPFVDMYWRHFRGPGPNNVPPPNGFLESLAPSTGLPAD